MNPAQHTILVIEDDASTSAILAKRLRLDGYEVDVAADGKAGLERARRQPRYNVILLDFMLPGMNGLDILRNMRLEGIRSRVLMISAVADFEARVRALREGADDYLTKPFDVREVVIRVEKLLKAASASAGEISFGDMSVSRKHRSVTRGGIEEILSEREFDLLLYLLGRPGEVVSKEDLLRNVWKTATGKDPNIVNVYVSYLRKKLERKGLSQPIETIHGVGIRMIRRDT